MGLTNPSGKSSYTPRAKEKANHLQCEKSKYQENSRLMGGTRQRLLPVNEARGADHRAWGRLVPTPAAGFLSPKNQRTLAHINGINGFGGNQNFPRGLPRCPLKEKQIHVEWEKHRQ